MDTGKKAEYREYVKNRFASYTKNYNDRDSKIRLKIDHTYRVATICEDIAKSLNLSDEDVLLAWSCGMLHDIGRFEQVRIYGTFFDSQSVDHAQFGADILFHDNLYEDMVPFEFLDGQRDTIEKAIRAHNKFRVPEELTEREILFSNILRDADKIDILRVNCDTPVEEVYNRTTEEFKTSMVSKALKTAFDEQRCTQRGERATAIDYLVGTICFVFELVFPISLKIVEEQGYIYILLSFKSDIDDTNIWFDHMTKEIREYLS